MTATTATTPAYRYLGITDECVECQQCGKTQLKSTVVLAVLDADGATEDVTYYGSSCAAKALGIKGGGRAVLQAARGWHQHTLDVAKDARERLAYYGLPETGEPEHAALRAAVGIYNRTNRNVCELVARTGIKVPDHVLAMMRRDQAAVADAAALKRAA